MNIFILSLCVSIIFNVLMFVFAYVWKTDKLTDLSYTISFIVITLSFFLFSPITYYSIIILILILFWSLRLGGYLFIRIRKIKRDKRFDERRNNFFAFLKFWLLQGISVWVIMLPIITFFDSENASIFFVFSIVGLVVWGIGFIIETIADLQKYKFINDPINKGKWIDKGLWYYSRHPNYFGEIIVWIGLFLFLLPVFSGWQIIIALISPLYIFILLRWVSGVPLLEKSAINLWGDNIEYLKYKKNTNMLIIWFKK